MTPGSGIRCGDCGAPATHEVLPRTRRGPRYVCEQGARILDPEHRRRLTAADFARRFSRDPEEIAKAAELPIADMAPGELVEAFGK